MNGWLLLPLVAAAGIWAFIDIMFILSVRKLSRPRPLLETVHDPQRAENAAEVSRWGS